MTSPLFQPHLGNRVIAPVVRALHKSHAAILASTLLLFVAACGDSQTDIVGKWSTGGNSTPMVWEFRPDSSVLMGGTQGKYTFGRNRIKIQTPFGTTLYQMDLSADRIILKDPRGSKLELMRVK